MGGRKRTCQKSSFAEYAQRRCRGQGRCWTMTTRPMLAAMGTVQLTATSEGKSIHDAGKDMPLPAGPSSLQMRTECRGIPSFFRKVSIVCSKRKHVSSDPRIWGCLESIKYVHRQHKAGIAGRHELEREAMVPAENVNAALSCSSQQHENR